MSCQRHRENQLTLTKFLIIPDNKPDIEKILRVASTPEVSKIYTIHKKVILTGKIHISVEYVACSDGNSQPMHFSDFEIPFSHFIDHHCAQPRQNARICISVEFQEVQVMNRRTFNIFLILKAVILKLDHPNIIVTSQVNPTQNITNLNLGANIACPHANLLEDCSTSQPCSFAACTIECE